MLKATLVGNLGQDPEMRYSAEGRPVLSFRVASNYRARTQEGAWEDRTEWVRVRVVGQRAETLSQYLRKGSRVYVDGRLEARPWLNNQSQPQSGLEIFATDVEFMSSRSDDEQMRGGGGGGNGGGGSREPREPRDSMDSGSPPPRSRPAPQSRPDPVDDGDLEDLPF
jgi:single-strand DNA-binding protein